ncbi:MAG: hypothetical protein AAB768_03805 [Patescibacteria group bacterium]
MYKIDKLLKLNRDLYHTGDLGILWEITNKNTLYTTIKRYVQKGILIPVHKGLYSTKPLNKLDPVSLGLAIVHNYAYASCEMVLAKEGLINQIVFPITLVSSKSQKFSVGGYDYVVRKLADKYLYNPEGIGTPERAVADMLYFRPSYQIDGENIIDWNQVKFIQKEVGYI